MYNNISTDSSEELHNRIVLSFKQLSFNNEGGYDAMAQDIKGTSLNTVPTPLKFVSVVSFQFR